MKRIIVGIVFSLFAVNLLFSYESLDTNNPIELKENAFVYQGVEKELGPLAFFIDAQLSETEAARSPYLFRSVNEAAQHLLDGSEEEPMTLYIAPNVYWIDDPDDPAVRKGKNGGRPYALEIECEWLRFEGLSQDPRNVVLACNRGQTMGSQGNFTMFHISGDGTSSENLTFGNYCNVDLEFPLKPELGRKKRGSAIVQAQLIICNGDKIVVRNTRFISRLNLCPFVGAKRILFDRCHFESTDDALCSTGVYLRSTLDFYSGKPFYRTSGTGAVFLDCDIRSYTRGRQYFTKSNGQLAVVDTRISSDVVGYIGWNDVTPIETRNYQQNVQLNGQLYLIGQDNAQSTVLLDEASLLNAYKFSFKGETIYNTYNLLKGDDDWDPDTIKEQVLQAESSQGVAFTDLPVQLNVTPTRVAVETGKEPITLLAQALRFGSYESDTTQIDWSLSPEYEAFATIEPSEDGKSCSVVATNPQGETRQIVVVARTPSGLQAASVIDISPKRLAPPAFTELPVIDEPLAGQLTVNYGLGMRFEDQSLVSWYRCSNANGLDPIKVAVSRLDQPLKTYTLNDGDIGYHIMVSVSPKHLRCDPGEPKSFVMRRVITASDVMANSRPMTTDFKNVSVGNQLNVLPGFWTFGPLAVERNGQVIPADNSKDAWFYGEGRQGNANMIGLLQTGRSASMLYTPLGETFGPMSVRLEVAPFKTAGQGFSVAPLYMDVLIKLDTENMTGYGLRFQRTTKYGNAVDCYFVKYENGNVEQLGEAISTSCFRTPCYIELSCNGNTLTAKASSNRDRVDSKFPELAPKVEMTLTIEETSVFGGFGIQYHGGSTTMINSLTIDWD